MKTGQFLSVPGNRAAARAISLQAAAMLAPSETRTSKRFIEPLLDMSARGESLTVKASDASMGLGGADLALMIVVPTVVQVLIQLLGKLGEQSIDAVKARGRKDKEAKQLVSIRVVDVPSEKGISEQVPPVELRQVLVGHFSEIELRDLCFDLQVDYELLPGEDKGDLAREIVAYLERRGRTSELVEAVKQLRPKISWADMSKAPTGDLSTLQSIPPVLIEITLQDIQGFVIGARLTSNKKRIQELASVIGTALQDYLAG